MNYELLNSKKIEMNDTLNLIRKKGTDLEEEHINEHIKNTFNALSVVEKILFNKKERRETRKKDYEFIRQRVRTHKKYFKFIEDRNIHIDGRDIIYITNDLKSVFSLDGKILIELRDYSESDNIGILKIQSDLLKDKHVLIEGRKSEFKQMSTDKILKYNDKLELIKFNGMTNYILFDIPDEEFANLRINCINSWGLPTFKKGSK